MNKSELAQKMLVWEEKSNELKKLEDEIVSAVLEVGETVKAGNVVASYSKGRRTFDYKAAWMNLYPDALPEQSKTTYDYEGAWKSMFGEQPPREEFAHVEYDWKASLPEGAEIPFVQAKPSVTLKLK